MSDPTAAQLQRWLDSISNAADQSALPDPAQLFLSSAACSYSLHDAGTQAAHAVADKSVAASSQAAALLVDAAVDVQLPLAMTKPAIQSDWQLGVPPPPIAPAAAVSAMQGLPPAAWLAAEIGARLALQVCCLPLHLASCRTCHLSNECIYLRFGAGDIEAPLQADGGADDRPLRNFLGADQSVSIQPEKAAGAVLPIFLTEHSQSFVWVDFMANLLTNLCYNLLQESARILAQKSGMRTLPDPR